LLFGVLVVATLFRMGAVAAQLNKIPDYTALLAWVPVVLWVAGALIVVVLVTRPDAHNVT